MTNDIATDKSTAPPRSTCLRAITHNLHEVIDQAVTAHAPFGSRESYGHFLQMQYLFQSELRALYQDPELGKLFPDLPSRCRAAAAKADLADLGLPVPEDVPGGPQGLSLAQSLGWLWVSEGSKLGAAILIKRAAALGFDKDFGARHLAEPEGGRMPGWRAFNQVFDGLPFSAAEDRQAEQAAIDAFTRVQVLLRHTYAGQPETV